LGGPLGRCTRHGSRRNAGAVALTLTAQDVARLDALPVSGEREGEAGDNWFDGVTPALG